MVRVKGQLLFLWTEGMGRGNQGRRERETYGRGKTKGVSLW